jgi:hypothetical protein
MTTGEQTLLGCTIAFVAVALLSIGGCGTAVYRGFTQFPEYAKREHAYPANKEVIDKLNSIISAESSFPAIQQKIAATKWSEKVLFIEIKEDEHAVKADTGRHTAAQTAEAFKRYSWNGNSIFMLNGSGHGSLNTSKGRIEIIIINNHQLNAKSENIEYTVYVEHQSIQR